MRHRAAIRIRYDEEVDALYVQLGASKIVESDEIKPGIIVDFNAKNEAVGIEVLDFKRRISKADLKQLKFSAPWALTPIQKYYVLSTEFSRVLVPRRR